MKSWFVQQGRIAPCLGIPLHDRGFRYGQHLFETIAIRNGKVLFFEEHWERLVAAARRSQFVIEALWYHTLSRFLATEVWSDGVIRIFVTAGEGAPLAPIRRPQLFLLWERADFPLEQKYQEGIEMVSLESPRGTSLWGEKTGNYWGHIQGLETAQRAGAEEGLVFDQEGFLISATMANVIIWLDNGQILTPSWERGARYGVTLAWSCQELPEIIQTDIERGILNQVKGMVITNSRLGVMPVSIFDGRRLSIPQDMEAVVRKYQKFFCSP